MYWVAKRCNQTNVVRNNVCAKNVSERTINLTKALKYVNIIRHSNVDFELTKRDNKTRFIDHLGEQSIWLQECHRCDRDR